MAATLSSRERRKFSIRKKVSGTAERPRLSVYRSSGHIYAQVIDDQTGTTIATAGTMSRDLRDALKDGTKTDDAKKVGALIAKICLEKKIEEIVFDRNGYLYHGRVKALAEAAREAGLKF